MPEPEDSIGQQAQSQPQPAPQPVQQQAAPAAKRDGVPKAKLLPLLVVVFVAIALVVVHSAVNSSIAPTTHTNSATTAASSSVPTSSVSGVTGPQPTTTVLQSPASGAGQSTYTNKEMNISFQYPSTWDMSAPSAAGANAGNLGLYPAALGSGTVSVAILECAYAPGTSSTYNVCSLNQILKETTVESQGNATVAGYKAYKVVVQYDGIDGILYSINLSTPQSERYIQMGLSYPATDNQSYSQYISEGQQILNSVEILT